MSRLRRNLRASAVVELVVLLPVLLLIIFAMLYVGELTAHKERTHFGSEYALNEAGDQSESAAATGPISARLYTNTDGELTVVEQRPDPYEIPVPGEIREMFDDMSQVVYSTTASGRYVFSGGQLRFVVTTSQNQGLSADGRYIQKYRLRDDNIPELTTDLAQAWIERDRVDLTYAYRPDYIQIGQYPLDEVDIATRLQTVIRADKDREVTNPPSGTHHQIETVTTNRYMRSPGRPAGYPDFQGDQPFWQPN